VILEYKEFELAVNACAVPFRLIAIDSYDRASGEKSWYIRERVREHFMRSYPRRLEIEPNSDIC
jgi:hypothetical protein